MKIIINLSVIFLIVFGLTSCAVQTLIKKANLDVQTKMSDTIFLEPVRPDKKYIYIDIRNTSDKDLHVEPKIEKILISNGYVLTQNPDSANFMLQANILKVGKSDLRESTSALVGGFGGAIVGAALLGNSPNSVKNVGLISGVFSFERHGYDPTLIEDVVYNMITDIQVRERPLTDESITQQQNTNISQGTGTKVIQKITGGRINWKTYRSRIVSTANKVNLKFDDAQKELEKGLIRAISGIF